MSPSFSHYGRRGRRGSALLIVLAMLLLLTPLVLAILFRTSSSVAASTNFSNRINANILAQTVVNLVISQIRQGTSGLDASGNFQGGTWSSQPGLIESHYVSGGGLTTTAYKLYSSNVMTQTVGGSYPVTGAGSDAAALTTDNWSTQPNLYTDLNSPVMMTVNGKPAAVFPIIDGNNMQSITLNGNPMWTYCTNSTAGNGATAVPDIEGFGVAEGASVDGVGNLDYKVPYTPVPGVPPTASNTPVPMPVKWLYMLQDGTLLPATGLPGGSGKDVTMTGTDAKGNPVPSATNPIIARVAFWTDDESSKINLNTAGEGTYWDTPVCVNQPTTYQGGGFHPPTNAYDPTNIFESDLACRQPVTNEYQSFPGHPGTTCLSPVFGASILDNLGITPGTVPTGTQRGLFVTTLDTLSPLYSDKYSSQNGTVGGSVLTSSTAITSTAIPYPAKDTNPTKSPTGSPLLYADSDEAFYNADRSERVLTGTKNGDQTPQLMAESRFFLTTTSSAPEINVFGKPRVAIWPVPLAKPTVFDQAIALCSTLGGSGGTPYYFTRSNKAGANAGSMSPTLDMTSSPKNRNQLIYNYLTNLTDTIASWPGYGGTFSSKYGADCDQIMTEIFDYIRCTNLSDQTPGAQVYTVNQAGANTTEVAPPGTISGEVVPSTITSVKGVATRGIGRIPTISEFALVMIKVDTRNSTTLQDPNPIPGSKPTRYNFQGYATAPKAPQPDPFTTDSLVEFAIIPQLFCPSVGFPSLGRDIKIEFSNSSIVVNEAEQNTTILTAVGSSANSTMLFTPPELPKATGIYLYDEGRTWDAPVQNSGDTINVFSTRLGSWIGPWSLTSQGERGVTLSPVSNCPTCMRLVQALSQENATALGGAHQTYITVGGSITCTITEQSSGAPLQTFTITFPPATQVPMPSLRANSVKSGYTFDGTFGKYPPVTLAGLASTIPQAGTASTDEGKRWNTSNSNFISLGGDTGTDTIRSIQASGGGTDGDLRLVAASANPTSGPNAFNKSDITDKLGCLPISQLFQGQPSYFILKNPYSYNFYCLQPSDAGDYWYSGNAAANPGPITNLPGGFAFKNNSTTNPNNYLLPGTLVQSLSFSTSATVSANVNFPEQYAPLPEAIQGVVLTDSNGAKQPGDWDNGPGLWPDGPYINMPDQGEGTGANFAYFGGDIGTPNGAGTVVADLVYPARQLPSPVMFGSLPTGVLAVHPWQTLLFRPAKSYLPGKNAHPGAASPVASDGQSIATYPPYTKPPDHALLDLFWMPTVMPTAISQPFATSGKVNLNYQIAPFTYIKRSTAMRAVLKSVDITALNPQQKTTTISSSTSLGTVLYKTYKAGGARPGYNGDPGAGAAAGVRRPIDLDKTLQQFDELYFDQNHPFITESQICDVPLIPAQSTIAGSSVQNISISAGASAKTFDSSLATFWQNNLLTGDNMLERPYVAIYPRVTTKSNVYTVHVRVQTLKKVPGDASTVATFRDGVDQVTSEYRGSFVVERYLDPATAGYYENGVQDTSANAEQDAQAQVGPYKFRILSTKQFDP